VTFKLAVEITAKDKEVAPKGKINNIYMQKSRKYLSHFL